MKIFCRGSTTACPIIILVTVILSLALSLKYFYEVEYTHFSIDSYPYLRDSFSSSQYRTSLFSTVLIGIPMTIESLIDGFSFIDTRLTEKICWATRLLLVLSLVLPKIILLVGNFRSGDVVQAHLCSIAFINIASRGCICIFLCLNHQKLDIGPICVSISIFYLIGVYIQLTNYSGGAHPALSSTSVFFVFAYGQFMYVFCRLLRTLVRHRYCPDDICTVIYFVGLLVLAGGSFLVDRYFGGECTQLSLSIDNYLIIIFLLIIALLPGQLVKLKYKEAIHKMAEKDAFIRYISHEIRTPLNTVFLGMSYIKGELRGIAPLVSEYVEPIIETVNEVNECCEVAVSILNDLLTFDKLEEGKMALELKDTDIENFVFETVKPFHILAREKGIALDITIDGQKTGWTNSSSLRIDHHKMSQVIRNLVSNAIKFTPTAGSIIVTVSLVKVFVRSSSKVLFKRMPSLTVIKTTLLPWLTYFSSESPPKLIKGSSCNSLEEGTHPKPVPHGGDYVDYLRIEVKDNGVGISSVNQTKLFGQYVQFNAGKLQEGNGSGLGLWISKAITELHGGCIGSSSAGEGKGSTFHVELPLFPTPSPPEKADLSGRSMSIKSYRKDNYPLDTVIMHPRGSGLSASVSFSDLVSLDRKIRGRGMSSEHLNLLDVTSSRPNSRRGSKVSIDINMRGLLEREKSCPSIILPMRQDSASWTGISKIFSRESVRVVVSDSDADPGVIGPCLRSREIVEAVKAEVRVLVVDDSSLTRKLLSKILIGKGFHVHCAVDGQSCLDMMETAEAQGSSVSYNNLYDVIIMDSSMPRMSGNETCKVLREKGFKGMICGVTGNTTQKDVESFIASGASLVLPKPLDINAFEVELRAFLRTETQTFLL